MTQQARTYPPLYPFLPCPITSPIDDRLAKLDDYDWEKVLYNLIKDKVVILLSKKAKRFYVWNDETKGWDHHQKKDIYPLVSRLMDKYLTELGASLPIIKFFSSEKHIRPNVNVLFHSELCVLKLPESPPPIESWGYEQIKLP